VPYYTTLSGAVAAAQGIKAYLAGDLEVKQVWQIVGEPEADAKAGRISISSPIARALINKKKGEVVEVVTPGGAKAYEIMKVLEGRRRSLPKRSASARWSICCRSTIRCG
jgi:transcription elongation GreA/GreB family factor